VEGQHGTPAAWRQRAGGQERPGRQAPRQAPGRAALADALPRATPKFLLAAVDSDRLYFPAQTRALAAALPGEVAVHTIEAPIGHDGFLTEIGQLTNQLRQHFFG